MNTTNKLFHVLVVMGASMTGAIGATACGSGVNPTAAADAAADGAQSYDNISPYGKISPEYGNISPSAPPDASADAADAQDAPSDG